MATVRYIVRDAVRARDFYTQMLDFTVEADFAPAFVRVRRDDLVLWLAGPTSSAGRAMPDGAVPAPGGWNRFVVETADLAALVAKLESAGARFRNALVSGPGGKQILLEDPDGNVIELFQAAPLPGGR